MALTPKIIVTLNTNNESINISDTTTDWGIGGNIDKEDVTSIIAKIYGRNSTSPDYEVTLSVSERTAFLAGSVVILSFVDDRWFGETYAPDNFYTIQLVINSLYTSDNGYFSLILELENLVHKNTTSTILSTNTYITSIPIIGSNVGIDTLKRIQSDTDVSRGLKWGLVYDYVYANITSKFKGY